MVLRFWKTYFPLIKLFSTANDRYSEDHYSGNNHYRGQIIQKMTVLEEIELCKFTGFEDTTALEDKKSLTVFPL